MYLQNLRSNRSRRLCRSYGDLQVCPYGVPKFFRKDIIVSIHPNDFVAWLDYIGQVAPDFIKSVTGITFAAPGNWGLSLLTELRGASKQLPNLQAVGFQGQIPEYSPDYLVEHVSESTGFCPIPKFRGWYMTDWMKQFPSELIVAVEVFSWTKPRSWRPKGIIEREKDHQYGVRLAREGKEEGNDSGREDGWTYDDIDINFQRPELVEWKRTAPWRKCWSSKKL